MELSQTAKFPTFRNEVLDFLRCTASESLISGPSDASKSYAALWKVHLTCLTFTGVRALLVRQKRIDLKDSAIPSLQEVLRHCPNVRDNPGIVTELGKSSPYQWDYYNGSKITLRGLDDHNYQQALGGSFDLIYVMQLEQVSERAFQTALTRATGRAGAVQYPQVIACANPSGPNHWILKRKNLQHYVATHRDNPMMYDEDGNETEEGTQRLAPLRALTGVTHKRLKKGEWSGEEGLIYTDFDTRIHVVDEPIDGIGKDRWIVVDWGYTNPAAVQWWAMDVDGRLCMIRETYRTGMTAADVANTIRHNTPDDENIIEIICDHDGANNAVLESELEIDTTKAKKGEGSVAGGIGIVRARLRVADDGRPRMYFVRDAGVILDGSLVQDDKPISTVEEFSSYVWKPNPQGTPTDMPRKQDDHGMDAMRYMAMQVDTVPERRMRIL